MIPPEFEYAEVRGNLGFWCIHRKGSSRFTLCTRRVYQIPEPHAQPFEPKNVHSECLQRLLDLPPVMVPPVREGRCPMCNGTAPVVGGRVGRHFLGETGEPCLGVNLKPRQVRR